MTRKLTWQFSSSILLLKSANGCGTVKKETKENRYEKKKRSRLAKRELDFSNLYNLSHYEFFEIRVFK